MAWPASILCKEISTANERSDLGINRSQAGQSSLPACFPFQVYVRNPDKAYTRAGERKNQNARRIHAQGFRRLSYVLMYPVMFRHR